MDGVTGNLLWIEIQEGKQRMMKKQYQELGSTAACVMRGVVASGDFVSLVEHESQNTENSDDVGDETFPKLFLGDSWFGSVNACAAISKAGHHGVFMVKTSHSRTPKKFLEENMKDFPGGTWVTLTGKTEHEGVELVCIGYKYNKKSVLTFISTRGAGSTKEGEPYEARFPDKFGNMCVRHVARPEVVSNYFKFSNVVDLHNQARQFDLALEKKWVTHNGYFRLYSTLVGMTVTDVWKLHKISGNSRDISISHFADELAADMIAYADSLANSPTVTPTSSVCVSTDASLSLSTITLPKDEQRLDHEKVVLPKGKQVRCIWCSRVDLIERKTTMKCMQCDMGFCRDCTGRDCWAKHLALGGVPVPPKRGTQKQKRIRFEADVV